MQDTKKANTWQFKTEHAQTDILNAAGGLQDFISAESIILCAGPAIKTTTLDTLIPIGLCDSVSIQQNRNIIQLFEIGSRLPYLLPGRTIAQLQLNRVVFNGSSLLGALTEGIVAPLSTVTNDSPGSELVGQDAQGRFYMNLASSFFNSSFGLAILYQDSDSSTNTATTTAGQWVAAFYAENCMVQSHQMNIQGQQYIVMESALVRCTNIAPMDVTGTL
jgi:hypothetical protein